MSAIDNEQSQTTQPPSYNGTGDQRLEENEQKPGKQNSGRKNRGRRGRTESKQDGQKMKELKKEETVSIVSSDVTAALAGLVLQSSANVDDSQFDFVPPGSELQQSSQYLPRSVESNRLESQELPQTPHPSLASSLGDYLSSQELKVTPSAASSLLPPPQEINEQSFQDDFANQQEKNSIQELSQQEKLRTNKKQDTIQEEKENVSVNNNVQKNFSKNLDECQDVQYEENGAVVEDGFCNGDVPSFDQYVMNGNDSDLVDSSGDEEQVTTGDILDDQVNVEYKDDIKSSLSVELVQGESMLLAQAAAEALKYQPNSETIDEGGVVPALTLPALEFQGGSDTQETPRKGKWFANFFGNRKEGTTTTPVSPRPPSPTDYPPAPRSLDGKGSISPQRSINDMKADIARLQEEAILFSPRKTQSSDDLVTMSHNREPSLHLWSSADIAAASDLPSKHQEGLLKIISVESASTDIEEPNKKEKILDFQDSANLDADLNESEVVPQDDTISENNKDQENQQSTQDTEILQQEDILTNTSGVKNQNDDALVKQPSIKESSSSQNKFITNTTKFSKQFEEASADNQAAKTKKDFSPVIKSSSLSTIVNSNNNDNNSQIRKPEKSASEARIDESKVEVPESVNVKAFASKLQTQLSGTEKEGMLRTYVHSITRRKSYTRNESGQDSFGRNFPVGLRNTSSVSSNSSVGKGPSFKSQASSVSQVSYKNLRNMSIDETSETTSQVSSENSKISKLRKEWESGAPPKKGSSDDEQESTPKGSISKSNIHSIMENFKEQTKKPPQKEEKQGGVKVALKMFQDAQPKPKQTKKTAIKMDSKFGQTFAQFQNASK